LEGEEMIAQLMRIYTRTATFLLSSVIILLVGHFVIGVREYLAGNGKVDPQLLAIDPRAYEAQYARVTDNEEIFDYVRQEGTHFEPYVHFRRDPIKTKYVNVDESGLRRTIKNPHAGAKKVFVLGGSTVWGTGASDELTIPSAIQSSLGSGFDVYNFGETGYVSAQELNQLLKALADGNLPDYVIFYDGNNDGYAGGYSPAIPRDPQKLRVDAQARQRADKDAFYRLVRDWFEPSNYSRLLWRVKASRIKNWEDSIAGKEAERAKQVVTYYEAHIRQVKALGKEYGFKAYFFWQPNMFNPLRSPVAYEREMMETASPVFIETQRQVYHEAKRALAGKEQEGVFFAGDLFNGVSEPVYLDWSHTTMKGNQIVADHIVENIRPFVGRAEAKRVSSGDSHSSLVAGR
jgi:lysophospholipase L1-like esterase